MSLYDVLQVAVQASPDEIRAAYLRLVQEHHPDRHVGGENDELRARFKEIQQAYEVLYDPDQRQLYDNKLSIPQPKQRTPQQTAGRTASPTATVRPIDPSRRRDVPSSWMRRGRLPRRKRPGLLVVFLAGLFTIAVLVVPECSKRFEEYSAEIIRPYEDTKRGKYDWQVETAPSQPPEKAPNEKKLTPEPQNQAVPNDLPKDGETEEPSPVEVEANGDFESPKTEGISDASGEDTSPPDSALLKAIRNLEHAPLPQDDFQWILDSEIPNDAFSNEQSGAGWTQSPQQDHLVLGPLSPDEQGLAFGPLGNQFPLSPAAERPSGPTANIAFDALGPSELMAEPSNGFARFLEKGALASTKYAGGGAQSFNQLKRPPFDKQYGTQPTGGGGPFQSDPPTIHFNRPQPAAPPTPLKVPPSINGDQNSPEPSEGPPISTALPGLSDQTYRLRHVPTTGAQISKTSVYTPPAATQFNFTPPAGTIGTPTPRAKVFEATQFGTSNFTAPPTNQISPRLSTF